ncbi:hypothetical protein A11Q_2524 [Pseudobdellovibrio exovorus JSS]|uniref:Uncharacterized protein n=2 Tax=Pseudobdellovibrio exovorus TaxID=453816 RepID=M4VE21_9BACT|nr:hypothetical protein A11Q_2524 [Pseudobdellovibrio exovorus JSS]
MMVITVALILGAKRAFSNVNEFMKSYIGDYYECLMEFGELPTLGVFDETLRQHAGDENGGQKVCNARFEGFTFANGRPPTGGGNNGGGSDGNGGNGSNGGNNSSSPGRGGSGSGRTGDSRDGRSGSGSDRNGNSSRNADGSSSRDGSGSVSGSDGSGGGSASSSSRGRRSSYADGKVRRLKGGYGVGDGQVGSDKVSVVDEKGSSDGEGSGGRRGRGRGGRGGSVRYVYERSKYRAITGRMEQEIERTAPKKQPPKVSAKTTAKVKGGEGLLPYKKTFTPPEPKREIASQNDDSGFSFGNFFKWLIIAAMVIAIVLFFGGQLLNYTNSKD